MTGLRSFLAPYNASPIACVVAFRMVPGCYVPPGTKTVYLATYFPPFLSNVTADEIARHLVRKACDHFKCSPQYLIA